MFEEKQKIAITSKYVLTAIIVIASLVGLYFLSSYDYLIFHVIVEFFSIVIAFAIFTIAWNTKHITENSYFLFIGITFVFVAILDLFHMLSYNGMNIFSPEQFPGANLATQLWLATRYLFAVSLLLPLLFIRSKVKENTILAAYTIVTGLLFASILVWQNFPLAYIAGTGLTMFKVASEFAISGIILVAIVFLVKKRNEFSDEIFKLLLVAMALGIATEMAFTVYTDVYGIMNMVGHLLNVISFFFIYVALVQTSLTKPYNLLFRDLKQSETNLAKHSEELTKVNEKLAQEIDQRTAVQKALEQSEQQLKLKLDAVLSPDIELTEEDLTNIIDVTSLQATMDYLYRVTNMAFALINLKGKVLVKTGWQDICTKFHRVNPETCRNCIESDLELSKWIEKGNVRLYKCKNNLWDVATPIFLGDKHVGNVFFGQFFFDDEPPDRTIFEKQAKKYGFDKEAYLAAFNRVPRFNRKDIDSLMVFYAQMSETISKLSYSNLKLAKGLNEQKELQLRLEGKAAEVEEYASQMEELAQERAKKLQDAERLSAIGATAGMVGHDIRNPLQAITNELYLAKKSIEYLPHHTKAELEESIQSMEDNIVYINKIVADLQDFAKPLNPKREQVDVENAVKDALAIVNIPENVAVSVKIAQNLSPLIADSTMIRRVIVNLAQNAIQAMPEGGNLTITAVYRKRKIVIALQDTGGGIPKEVQPKLFTPLMTTKSKGQGFGLAVVKRMTEAMCGKVSYTSQQEKGTTFTLEFPA